MASSIPGIQAPQVAADNSVDSVLIASDKKKRTLRGLFQKTQMVSDPRIPNRGHTFELITEIYEREMRRRQIREIREMWRRQVNAQGRSMAPQADSHFSEIPSAAALSRPLNSAVPAASADPSDSSSPIDLEESSQRRSVDPQAGSHSLEIPSAAALSHPLNLAVPAASAGRGRKRKRSSQESSVTSTGAGIGIIGPSSPANPEAQKKVKVDKFPSVNVEINGRLYLVPLTGVTGAVSPLVLNRPGTKVRT